jgi:methylisocitrate lyase
MKVTQMNNPNKQFKALLHSQAPVIVPSAYDTLTSLLVQKAGFPAVHIGSYSVASAMGMPDVGLIDMTELAMHAGWAASRLCIPVIADAEDGFYSAANIWRTVEVFERAGVAAIHFDDQVAGKFSDAPKRLAPIEEMQQKIRAALEARKDPDFTIIARTDVAWATGNVADVITRINAFEDAGAEVVMPVGLSLEDLAIVRRNVNCKLVIVSHPPATVASEHAAGADIVIYHSLCLFAGASAVSKTLQEFKKIVDAGAGIEAVDAQAELHSVLGYEEYRLREIVRRHD